MHQIYVNHHGWLMRVSGKGNHMTAEFNPLRTFAQVFRNDKQLENVRIWLEHNAETKGSHYDLYRV